MGISGLCHVCRWRTSHKQWPSGLSSIDWLGGCLSLAVEGLLVGDGLQDESMGEINSGVADGNGLRESEYPLVSVCSLMPAVIGAVCSRCSLFLLQ